MKSFEFLDQPTDKNYIKIYSSGHHRKQRSLKKSLREILNEKNVEKVEKKISKSFRSTSLNHSKTSVKKKESILIQNCENDSPKGKLHFQSDFSKSKSLATITKRIRPGGIMDKPGITERRKTGGNLKESDLIHYSLQNIAKMNFLMNKTHDSNHKKYAIHNKNHYSDFKKNCFFKNFSKKNLKVLNTPTFNKLVESDNMRAIKTTKFDRMKESINFKDFEKFKKSNYSFSKRKNSQRKNSKFNSPNTLNKENNINVGNIFYSIKSNSPEPKKAFQNLPEEIMKTSPEMIISPSKALYLKTKNSKSMSLSTRVRKESFKSSDSVNSITKNISTLRANTSFDSKKRSGFVKSFAVRTIKNEELEEEQNVFIRVSAHFTSRIEGDKKIPITYFGVFRGTKSPFCANFMKDNLRKFIFGCKYFPKNMTMAIKYGLRKASKAFLKLQSLNKKISIKSEASCMLFLSIGNNFSS